MQVKILSAGYCTHLECIALRTGKFRLCRFPAIFGLIIHPLHGLILYDTGYSKHFYEQTKNFPDLLYRRLIPIHYAESKTAIKQIEALGYKAEDVKYIIISHFHADHIAGLRDFPNAQFICSRTAYDTYNNWSHIRKIVNGFVSKLLPDNFLKRCRFSEDTETIPLPADLQPFRVGFDLFGDKSLIAIELPGHANGQLGLFMRDNLERNLFFVADACWLTQSYKEYILPHLAARIAIHDWQKYQNTLLNIHRLYQANPNMLIIPSHCEGVLAYYE